MTESDQATLCFTFEPNNLINASVFQHTQSDTTHYSNLISDTSSPTYTITSTNSTISTRTVFKDAYNRVLAQIDRKDLGKDTVAFRDDTQEDKLAKAMRLSKWLANDFRWVDHSEIFVHYHCELGPISLVQKPWIWATHLDFRCHFQSSSASFSIHLKHCLVWLTAPTYHILLSFLLKTTDLESLLVQNKTDFLTTQEKPLWCWSYILKDCLLSSKYRSLHHLLTWSIGCDWSQKRVSV